ncbi:MAG: M20/M25/M40 family metallo-hydrolase [Saprospiraceae bacterium]|nr:M20/M25/M40 family metallo-hydrolase [Saprospiraceae bacterium]
MQFLVIALMFALSACSPKVKYPIALPKQNIAMDIITLSSDDMEGREIGTEGERKAAEYISGRFKAIGLQPMGDDNTFFQHFTRKMNKNPHGDDTGVGPEVKGKNVVGYLNNNAKTTVIIGGHYDHLGYGHEGSLYTGDLAIHNGADDNASGVAGVLFLAESIKKAGLKNNNYLFICFSGEEKGLWGSNYFINHTALDKNAFNYMVNMDMIGRLNAERKLSISGLGTTPVFESVIDGIKTPKFSIKKELSGLGPSDHASFYNAGIPVLAFFTGQHSDYHKPSDDHQYINYSGITDIVQYIYSVVNTLDKNEKLPFVKTKDESQTRMAFTVTLGVMPDYMYDGKGMKIDGTKDGKAANLAGIQKGDIVIKMGELDVPDMQSYMKCLSLFKPGQTVDVTVLRDGKEIVKKVTF